MVCFAIDAITLPGLEKVAHVIIYIETILCAVNPFEVICVSPGSTSWMRLTASYWELAKRL